MHSNKHTTHAAYLAVAITAFMTVIAICISIFDPAQVKADGLAFYLPEIATVAASTAPAVAAPELLSYLTNK